MKKQFLDGCHRWGWLIAPVLAVTGQAVLLAFFAGGLNQAVKGLSEDVHEMKGRLLVIESKVK